MTNQPRKEYALIQHPGLPGGQIKVKRSDIDALENAGMLRRIAGDQDDATYDITPEGYAYVDALLSGAANS